MPEHGGTCYIRPTRRQRSFSKDQKNMLFAPIQPSRAQGSHCPTEMAMESFHTKWDLQGQRPRKLERSNEGNRKIN